MNEHSNVRTFVYALIESKYTVDFIIKLMFSDHGIIMITSYVLQKIQRHNYDYKLL